MTAPQRCTRHVFSSGRADVGGHRCGRTAAPGDELCTQHRKMLQPDAPRQQPAATPPATETWVRTTVRLTWPQGKGPVFRTPYGTRDVQWRWLQVHYHGDLSPDDNVGGLGHVLRKDGTPGQQSTDAGYMKLSDLPEDVQQMFTDAARGQQ